MAIRLFPSDQHCSAGIGWLVIVMIFVTALTACSSKEQPAAASDNAPWKLGVHYVLLDPPLPTEATAGKIEVVQVFLYSCHSCYAFEPHMVLWENSKPEIVALERLPMVLNDTTRSYARLYYTLVRLGRFDLHQAVFDSIHRDGERLIGRDDEKSASFQLKFATKNGIDGAVFRKTYLSSEISAQVDRADKLSHAYRLDASPTFVINGHFKTDPQRAGGFSALPILLNALVESESASP